LRQVGVLLTATMFCYIRENFELIVNGISESFIVSSIRVDVIKHYEDVSKN